MSRYAGLLGIVGLFASDLARRGTVIMIDPLDDHFRGYDSAVRAGRAKPRSAMQSPVLLSIPDKAMSKRRARRLRGKGRT